MVTVAKFSHVQSVMRDYPEVVKAVFLHCVSDRRGVGRRHSGRFILRSVVQFFLDTFALLESRTPFSLLHIAWTRAWRRLRRREDSIENERSYIHVCRGANSNKRRYCHQ